MLTLVYIFFIFFFTFARFGIPPFCVTVVLCCVSFPGQLMLLYIRLTLKQLNKIRYVSSVGFSLNTYMFEHAWLYCLIQEFSCFIPSVNSSLAGKCCCMLIYLKQKD